MDRSNQEKPHSVLVSTQHAETIEGSLQKRQLQYSDPVEAELQHGWYVQTD